MKINFCLNRSFLQLLSAPATVQDNETVFTSLEVTLLSAGHAGTSGPCTPQGPCSSTNVPVSVNNSLLPHQLGSRDSHTPDCCSQLRNVCRHSCQIVQDRCNGSQQNPNFYMAFKNTIIYKQHTFKKNIFVPQ